MTSTSHPPSAEHDELRARLAALPPDVHELLIRDLLERKLPTRQTLNESFSALALEMAELSRVVADARREELSNLTEVLRSTESDRSRLEAELEKEREGRQRAELVVGFVLAKQDLDPRECLLCDRYYWPGSSYSKPHADDCPLVTNGFVTKEGHRVGREGT